MLLSCWPRYALSTLPPDTQVRTYHDEERKGEGSVFDLRNAITLKPSRDVMVRDGVDLTISVAGRS